MFWALPGLLCLCPGSVGKPEWFILSWLSPDRLAGPGLLWPHTSHRGEPGNAGAVRHHSPACNSRPKLYPCRLFLVCHCCDSFQTIPPHSHPHTTSRHLSKYIHFCLVNLYLKRNVIHMSKKSHALPFLPIEGNGGHSLN